MGHGARVDEDEEEGAEGKGEGAVAARKLQDSIGRGKKREEESDSSGGVLFLEFFPFLIYLHYIIFLAIKYGNTGNFYFFLLVCVHIQLV